MTEFKIIETIDEALEAIFDEALETIFSELIAHVKNEKSICFETNKRSVMPSERTVMSSEGSCWSGPSGEPYEPPEFSPLWELGELWELKNPPKSI